MTLPDLSRYIWQSRANAYQWAQRIGMSTRADPVSISLVSPRKLCTDPKTSTLVQNYISSVFKRLGWHEEQVSPFPDLAIPQLIIKNPFKSDTPIGELDFTNLIYTFDPDAPRKIVIAAHFDSKYFPDFPANQVCLLQLYTSTSFVCLSDLTTALVIGCYWYS